MKDTFSFTFNTENVTISRLDGQIYCKGYDLENERIALTLAGGFGQGVGVILLALAEMDSKKSLSSLLKTFPSQLARVERTGQHPQTSPLLYHYLSYSPNVQHRSAAALYGKLSMSAWKRLLHDRDQNVAWFAARRATGPAIALNKLVKHRLVGVRENVARNPNLSFSSRLLLANDKSPEVRAALLYGAGSKVPLVIKKVAEVHSAKAQVKRREAALRHLRKEMEKETLRAEAQVKQAQEFVETTKLAAQKLLQEHHLKEKKEKELGLN